MGLKKQQINGREERKWRRNCEEREDGKTVCEPRGEEMSVVLKVSFIPSFINCLLSLRNDVVNKCPSA